MGPLESWGLIIAIGACIALALYSAWKELN